MKYEAVQDGTLTDAWRVEAVDAGRQKTILVAEFSGPNAEACALEYQEWKSSVESDLGDVD